MNMLIVDICDMTENPEGDSRARPRVTAKGRKCCFFLMKVSSTPKANHLRRWGIWDATWRLESRPGAGDCGLEHRREEALELRFSLFFSLSLSVLQSMADFLYVEAGSELDCEASKKDHKVRGWTLVSMRSVISSIWAWASMKCNSLLLYPSFQ